MQRTRSQKNLNSWGEERQNNNIRKTWSAVFDLQLLLDVSQSSDYILEIPRSPKATHYDFLTTNGVMKFGNRREHYFQLMSNFFWSLVRSLPQLFFLHTLISWLIKGMSYLNGKSYLHAFMIGKLCDGHFSSLVIPKSVKREIRTWVAKRSASGYWIHHTLKRK